MINPDNTFSIKVDSKPVLSGRLGSEDEFDPALSPVKEIDDPTDKKPADWVDEKMVLAVCILMGEQRMGFFGVYSSCV